MTLFAEPVRPRLPWSPTSTVGNHLGGAPRNEVVSELPRLPRSYFDAEIPQVDGWTSTPAAYLKLSAGYDRAASQADALGWPVERIEAAHLHAVVDPDAVASGLLRLMERTAPCE